MVAAIGSGKLHAVRGGWSGGPVAPSACWCGAAICDDHGGQCDRCGWSRYRANLTRVRLSAAQSILQCRDGCEGRPDQYDA